MTRNNIYHAIVFIGGLAQLIKFAVNMFYKSPYAVYAIRDSVTLILSMIMISLLMFIKANWWYRFAVLLLALSTVLEHATTLGQDSMLINWVNISLVIISILCVIKSKTLNVTAA